MALNDVLKSIKKRYDFQKEAEVAGVKFELGLLTLKEEQMTQSIDTTKLDGFAYINETRRVLLSYAIKKLDGEDVPAIVEIKEEGKDPVSKEKSIYLREFLEGLPADLIAQLFEIYVDIKEEAEVRFSKDIKYNWYKTPEVRAKEREEEIKKASEEQKETEKPVAPNMSFTEIPKTDEDEEPKA